MVSIYGEGCEVLSIYRWRNAGPPWVSQAAWRGKGSRKGKAGFGTGERMALYCHCYSGEQWLPIPQYTRTHSSYTHCKHEK